MTEHTRPGDDDDRLARALEAALAADPSPQFRAGVRARVAHESIGPAWAGWRRAATMGALAVAGGLALLLVLDPAPRPGPGDMAQHATRMILPDDGSDASGVSAAAPSLARELAPPATDTGRVAAENAATTRTPTPPAPAASTPPVARAPEVIISAGEAAVLRRLFTGVSRGEFEVVVDDDLLRPSQLSIEAIAIEPIPVAPLPPIEANDERGTHS